VAFPEKFTDLDVSVKLGIEQISPVNNELFKGDLEVAVE
jgi:hypothetical protein